MSSFKWEPGNAPRDMIDKIRDEIADKERFAITLISQFYAPKVEAWMKTNAIWTDRTGNARQSLYTWVDEVGDTIILWLSHGVKYGIYLETRFSGRYSIIDPSIDYFFPRIMQDIRNTLGTGVRVSAMGSTRIRSETT